MASKVNRQNISAEDYSSFSWFPSEPVDSAFGLRRIHLHELANRAKIGGAFDGVGLLASAVQRGQQYGDQQRDDGDHHQQLDKCKTAA